MGGEFPSALPMALFQLLWAGEASLSPCCAPKCPFRTFRCFAWLIHDFAPSPMRALVFRSAYSASRNARASAAFAASIKAHCAVSSETLMLQVRCANPPMPHRTSSLSCSGVPVGLLATSAPSRLSARWRSVRLIGCLRTIPPYGVLAFRSAYWLRQTLELQSLRDLRQAQTLDLQVRSAHPPNCTRPATALNPCTI